MAKTSCVTSFLVLVFVACLGSSVAFGGPSKYQRPTGGAATDDSAAAGTATAPSSSPAPGAASGPEKKVDLSDLENRYWTAKDTEFNVVQNRLYTKAKRFSITPMVGTDLSSVYTNDFDLGLQLNYYFSERQGVGIQGWKTSGTAASFVSQFQQVSNNSASYNFNFPQGYIGANYNWVPIYAKLSLLEKKILYFDMSINPGLGVTFLQSNSFGTTLNSPQSVSQSPITLALDISQQVFLSEHWAIKLDIDSHLYQETTYWAASGTNGSVAGTSQSTKFTYSAIFMLGVTFFQ